MANPAGLLDRKVGYRVLLKHLLDLPPDEALKQLDILLAACEHAKEYAGKVSPLMQGEPAIPFGKDGWDEGIELFKALKKTIF